MKIGVKVLLFCLLAGPAFSADPLLDEMSGETSPVISAAPAPSAGHEGESPVISPDIQGPQGLTLQPLEGGGSHVREAEHSISAGLPQMDPTWFASQVFWMAVTFVLLYAVFSTKILPDISSTLEKRRNQIQGDLDTAQKLRDNAEEVKAAYEALMLQARDKASAFFSVADDKIKKKTFKAMEGFALRAEKETKLMEESITEAKNVAMGEMHTVAADLARHAAEKIIGLSTDLDQTRALIEDIQQRKVA